MTFEHIIDLDELPLPPAIRRAIEGYLGGTFDSVTYQDRPSAGLWQVKLLPTMNEAGPLMGFDRLIEVWTLPGGSPTVPRPYMNVLTRRGDEYTVAVAEGLYRSLVRRFAPKAGRTFWERLLV